MFSCDSSYVCTWPLGQSDDMWDLSPLGLKYMFLWPFSASRCPPWPVSISLDVFLLHGHINSLICFFSVFSQTVKTKEFKILHKEPRDHWRHPGTASHYFTCFGHICTRSVREDQVLPLSTIPSDWGGRSSSLRKRYACYLESSCLWRSCPSSSWCTVCCLSCSFSPDDLLWLSSLTPIGRNSDLEISNNLWAPLLLNKKHCALYEAAVGLCFRNSLFLWLKYDLEIKRRLCTHNRSAQDVYILT